MSALFNNECSSQHFSINKCYANEAKVCILCLYCQKMSVVSTFEKVTKLKDDGALLNFISILEKLLDSTISPNG